jgi:hypothetical protein
MKLTCSVCGERYILSHEEEELFEAGLLETRMCDDCYEESESMNDFHECLTDSDPGL